MHSVAFSSDGSLIAVGTGDCVVLWNAETLSLVAALPSPSLEDSSLSMLTFVPGTPYLAGKLLNLVQQRQEGLVSPRLWFKHNIICGCVTLSQRDRLCCIVSKRSVILAQVLRGMRWGWWCGIC